MRVYKETLARRQKDAEVRLERHQKDALDFSMRRFKRLAIVSLHNLEQRLLKEVCDDGACQFLVLVLPGMCFSLNMAHAVC